jgi:hypothetical protein
MQLRGEITHNASSTCILEGFKTLIGVGVAGIKTLVSLSCPINCIIVIDPILQKNQLSQLQVLKSFG